MGLFWDGSHTLARGERQEVITGTTNRLEMETSIQRLSEGKYLLSPVGECAKWVTTANLLLAQSGILLLNARLWVKWLWEAGGFPVRSGRMRVCFYPGVFPSSQPVVSSHIRLNTHEGPITQLKANPCQRLVSMVCRGFGAFLFLTSNLDFAEKKGWLAWPVTFWREGNIELETGDMDDGLSWWTGGLGSGMENSEWGDLISNFQRS